MKKKTPKPDKIQQRSWGGRFADAPDRRLQRFTASVAYDQRLAPYDLAGSVTHARALAKAGVLEDSELEAIEKGLAQIRHEIESGQFNWTEALEDVHTNIEARLIELIGVAGKKLHTGRSRNDQVATDLRLYLRDAIDALNDELERAQVNILDLAEAHTATIMPGFTHLQTAQPVTFGHHLMAWFEMLERDRGRLADCRRRLNVSPLGSAALAGSPYPLDRQAEARELGFDAVTENSLDAVSDRDFALEFAAATAVLGTHLSRMAEELVLWNSQQFGFVELPDAFCTGSSIMPQKKNPDVAELIRGKAGRALGNLVTLLAVMKSQPLAYNRDNQEDKEALFDSVDTALACTAALADLVPALQPDAERMRAAAVQGYSTATDLADYLVNRGLAFRDAHELVGRAVVLASERGLGLEEMEPEELQKLSPAMDIEAFKALAPEQSVRARNLHGGTAPAQVQRAIARARKGLQRARDRN